MRDRQSHLFIQAAMKAAWWLNEQLEAWLSEKNVAETLTPARPPTTSRRKWDWFLLAPFRQKRPMKKS